MSSLCGFFPITNPNETKLSEIKLIINGLPISINFYVHLLRYSTILKQAKTYIEVSLFHHTGSKRVKDETQNALIKINR